MVFFSHKTKYLFILFFNIFFWLANVNYSLAISRASDLLSSSLKGEVSRHTISFRIHDNIPPSGKIAVIFPDNTFIIPDTFDYNDVSLAVADSANGPFADRTLGASSTSLVDGVGVSTSSPTKVSITLNSTSGISANSFIRLILGTDTEVSTSSGGFIINPATSTAYRIHLKTFDDNNKLLEKTQVMVAVVEPVTGEANVLKMRSYGAPSGVLAAGTVSTIMSLVTNYVATCRYSTEPNTDYYNMPYTFSYTGYHYHSVILTGLTAGTYYYYIRCLDDEGVADTDDYIITFTISEEGLEAGGAGAGTGGAGVGGGGGGGLGTGLGVGTGEYLPNPPLPENPDVILEGWAYPYSKVILLLDGQEKQNVVADVNGAFSFGLSELTQGVYTFGIRAKDSDGLESITNNSTFYIQEGTKTVVSDIFLSPTISLSQEMVEPGAIISASGQTRPGSIIEIWLYPDKSNLSDDEIIKAEKEVDSSGKWQVFINTTNLNSGTYKIKTRASYENIGYSEFSKELSIGIGEAPAKEEGECPGADLNHDGRVNITDFSILLYYWNSNNACADQNHDGSVNLIDFSIMMYYWTG